jgi:hypothetical protein
VRAVDLDQTIELERAEMTATGIAAIYAEAHPLVAKLAKLFGLGDRQNNGCRRRRICHRHKDRPSNLCPVNGAYRLDGFVFGDANE